MARLPGVRANRIASRRLGDSPPAPRIGPRSQRLVNDSRPAVDRPLLPYVPVTTDRDERRVRALADGLRRAINEGMTDAELGAIARAVLDSPTRTSPTS
jgi:hypothetical protein